MSDTTKRQPLPDYINPENDNGIYIGQYQLGRRLAKTRMSLVYEALATDLLVALKVPLERDDHLFEAINREGEALRKVGDGIHVPNLVHALYQPVPALAIEFLQGLPLNRYANCKTQPYREAFAFDFIETIRQMALSLQHVHEKGVLHRDVKPSNIMVTPENDAKLIDFGIAHLPDNHPLNPQDPEMVLGTVRYMSPEQINEPLSIGPPADVYSLTRTLLELLVGLPSPSTPSLASISMRTAFELTFYEGRESPPAHMNPQINKRWSKWIAEGVDKDAEHRCQSAAELANRLETILKEAKWEPQKLQLADPTDKLPDTATCSTLRNKRETDRVLLECATASFN